MSITRWDPWGEMVGLRDAIDRLVSESFIRPLGGGDGGRSQTVSLAIDVRDEGDHFTVTASVPGVSPDDVEITVLGDTVRIRGERREQRSDGGEGQRWIVREQRYGAFERMVRLPTSVKADAAQADFKDGVLTIELPKSDEAKERRILIGSRQGQGGQSQGQEIPVESASSGSSSQQASPASGSASTAATGEHA